ncbi:MAG: hypothetical protein JWM86_2775 [Thermoleophilia bacterium]|nr:hypothetical protein [Thermoleophilia bacterium]
MVGAAAGVAGVGLAIGLHVAGRDEPAKAEDAARLEWDTWKSKLDAEFPDRTLGTAADEERFERFLAANPAPKWIRVEHEGLRQISIDPFDPTPVSSGIGGIGVAAAVGVGLLAGFGGAALRYSRGASQAMQSLGAAGQVGGAALGLASIGGMFLQPKADSLVREIEASEWHTPSKWYH